jgi:hypothetical protein
MGEVFDDQVFLWPDNQVAWQCWCAAQTQWRIGLGGPTGLDYAGVQALLELSGVRKATRPEIFACLVGMERAALEEFGSKAKEH